MSDNATAGGFEPTPPTDLPNQEQVYGLGPNFVFGTQKREESVPITPPPPTVESPVEQQPGASNQQQQRSIPPGDGEKTQTPNTGVTGSSKPPVDLKDTADQQASGEKSSKQEGLDSGMAWDDEDEPGFQ